MQNGGHRLVKTSFLDIYKQQAVIDNNIIQDFIDLNQLPILNKIFDRIIIPQDILNDEVLGENLLLLNQLKFSTCTISTEKGYEIYCSLLSRKKLSHYDRILLSIAKENSLLCTSNDKPIRLVCEELNMKVTGTLGILCCAYEKEFLSYEDFCLFFNTYLSLPQTRIGQDIENEIRRLYNIKKFKTNNRPI